MLRTQVRYLARDDLFQREKPYAADFEVNEESGVRQSNFIIQECEVMLMAKTSRSGFDLDTNGFCILEEDTSLTLDDALLHPQQAELEYQAQLEEILHKHLPMYTRLEALDFVVRQRHPRFPSETTEVIRFEQPAAVAHTDYSLEGAIHQLRGSFPGQESHFVGKDFDMIKYIPHELHALTSPADRGDGSVWKPLAGPNNDWPLALCDYSSVLPSDIVHADVLHADRITENQLLYPNQNHRWYYIQDQQPNQLFVFRNVGSTGSRAVGFHAAVPNVNSKSPPRISIEVRFVAFR